VSRLGDGRRRDPAECSSRRGIEGKCFEVCFGAGLNRCAVVAEFANCHGLHDS
jgi:hypothetical protein